MVSHRSQRHRTTTPRHKAVPPARAGTRLTVWSAAAATAASVASLGTGSAGAAPTDERVDAGTRIDKLYVDAERATEKYNAAAAATKKLQRQLSRTQDRAARSQAEVNRLRDSLASVAGGQYRSAGLDPTLALLLSTDPESYLDRAAAVERVGVRAAGRLAELRRAHRVLLQYRQEGDTQLAQLEQQRAELSQRRQSVRGKLATAQRLLNQLTPKERADRERGDRAEPRTRAAAPGERNTASASAAPGRAGAALAAARSALGLPYAWGQAGPSAFDCAGLTQWAYRQAGVAIPRTSQAQKGAGRPVSLDQARPGDLVFYRADASHVALYAGGGQVIHSPYPGASVRYDPVGMMPVSSVTRP